MLALRYSSLHGLRGCKSHAHCCFGLFLGAAGIETPPQQADTAAQAPPPKESGKSRTSTYECRIVALTARGQPTQKKTQNVLASGRNTRKRDRGVRFGGGLSASRTKNSCFNSRPRETMSPKKIRTPHKKERTDHLPFHGDTQFFWGKINILFCKKQKQQ